MSTAHVDSSFAAAAACGLLGALLNGLVQCPALRNELGDAPQGPVSLELADCVDEVGVRVDAEHFAAGVTFDGAARFNSSVTLGDLASDAITLNGVMSCTGGGHIRKRTVFGVFGADADGNYGVNSADVVVIDSSTLTANRAYALTATGAASGSTIRFITEDATNAVTITPSAGAVTVLRAASGVVRCVEYTYTGTTWHVSDISFQP